MNDNRRYGHAGSAGYADGRGGQGGQGGDAIDGATGARGARGQRGRSGRGIRGHALTYFCVFAALTVSLVAQHGQAKTNIAAQKNRVEAIGLVCDQNRILIKFIEAKPDLPRDAPALHALRAERCEEILNAARAIRDHKPLPRPEHHN